MAHLLSATSVTTIGRQRIRVGNWRSTARCSPVARHVVVRMLLKPYSFAVATAPHIIGVARRSLDEEEEVRR